MMSFETWMGIMEQEMLNVAILFAMKDEEMENFKKTYLRYDVWRDSYRDGLSPHEALEAEMSYWGDE